MASLSLATSGTGVVLMPPLDVQELYELHSELVYRTALRVTGNPADAEDALQSVFARLIAVHEIPNAAALPKQYFRKAAANAALDILRRKSTRAETPIDYAAQRASHGAPALLKEELRRALAEVEPRDAELFVLRFVEGLDNEELAGMFGVEKGWVAVRLHRIRLQLQAALSR